RPSASRPRRRRPAAVVSKRRGGLDASGPGEFPGLEAFLAEDRTALRRPEGDGRLLAARRAIRNGFHPFASDGASRTAGPLAFARFAALRLVLEVLVGEQLLFSRRPDELRAAVHALKDSVLELHRSLPRRGRSSYSARTTRARAGASCDCVFSPGPALPGACHQVSNRRNAS